MTDAKRNPRESYMLYARGFRDGAAFVSLRHPGEPSYEEGYSDGRDARNTALNAFCKRIGYTPSILRHGGAHD